MSCEKLLKLMYIAEKQFLLTYGELLTGDKMVSMPRGPVLSSVYDCIGNGRDAYWEKWITNSGDDDLALNSSVVVDAEDPLETFDELSEADKKVLDSVYAEFGGKNRRELVDLLHDPDFCPEWKNPREPCPIHAADLLMKNGKTKAESDAILKKLAEEDDLLAVTQRVA